MVGISMNFAEQPQHPRHRCILITKHKNARRRMDRPAVELVDGDCATFVLVPPLDCSSGTGIDKLLSAL